MINKDNKNNIIVWRTFHHDRVVWCTNCPFVVSSDNLKLLLHHFRCLFKWLRFLTTNDMKVGLNFIHSDTFNLVLLLMANA